MRIRACLLTAAAVLTLTAAQPEAQRQPDLRGLQTRAERTAHRETSSYDDVMAFLDAVDRASPRIAVTTFGYTSEGRPLPLAVVGGGADPQPKAVRASGKTRVYIQANIHAGEVEGKESTLALLRALANGAHKEWLDSMVLLVAPIYNADGNERVTLVNRGRQHGPIGGMGQRPNAQGYDLNRDHMKLDTSEARSVARLMTDYDPHVAIDLHTTNGSRHAYHLTYSPPLHPNTDASIVERLRGDWLPSLTKAIKAKHGWDFYYYGNLNGPRGSERGWWTFDHRPRFGNNYVGLRNRFAVLSEAYSYLPFKERIEVTDRFVEENLAYIHRHAAELRQATAAVDAKRVVGQKLALRATFKKSGPVEILIGDVAEERHPYTGEIILRRLDVRKPEMLPEYGTFEGTEWGVAPARYYVPAALGGVVDRLETHGIAMSRVEAPLTRRVQQFRIDGASQTERPFEKHQERTLTGAYESVDATIPAGTYVVSLDQPLGRLAFMLLEPRSDDGLLNWNVLDEALKDAPAYPILREPAATPATSAR